MRSRGLPALCAAVAATATLSAPAAHAATTCVPPKGTEDFQRVAPEQVDLNGARVRSATRFMTSRLALSVRVYRHGCLAATSDIDRWTERNRNNIWSATKGMTALLTGRAITQGKLGLDDPIGKYLPDADAAHGQITVRQLLTQTSGLRFAWISDVFALNTVRYTLALPFAHAPGTYFEYAQTTVTLLADVVEHAVGEDLKDYADRELLGPLGIPRGDWNWSHDPSGQTQGFAYLHIAPRHLGRIGQFLLQGGRWNGVQRIDPAYMRELHAPSPANPGYGFLTWTNEGGSMITATAPSRRVIDEPFLPTAPPDTYAFVGFMGQLIVVIPSLDMVVVRTGFPGNTDPDLHSLLTSKSGDMDYEGMRRLMQAVTDVDVPDPGPYTVVRRFESFTTSKWFDPKLQQLAGLR
ncbi:MAG: serine hydrolase [Solirubrobacteraceae bacterium]|nr:serine hydrolase [Solirubrobacteraceae bacterium]